MVKNTVAGDRLRSFVERIETLEEEKKAVAEQIKEVKAEAKAEGYDAKILALVLKVRKMDPDERDEQEALLSMYLAALEDL